MYAHQFAYDLCVIHTVYDTLYYKTLNGYSLTTCFFLLDFDGEIWA